MNASESEREKVEGYQWETPGRGNKQTLHYCETSSRKKIMMYNAYFVYVYMYKICQHNVYYIRTFFSNVHHCGEQQRREN